MLNITCPKRFPRITWKLIFQRYLSVERTTYPKIIFSGIQPTGGVHLGNYFGAIRKWVELQDAGEKVIYSIVDLHSITLPQNPTILKKNILLLMATLLACGIDTEKAILYVQSSVRQHAELCWVLLCSTTMARLAHLPQYKEKSSLLKNVLLGIYLYPVLQAADILLYKATHVPVGEDQLHHIQLVQHLSKIFNTKYGETFPICQGVVAQGETARLRSLRDPSKKMSKSDLDKRSCIYVTDTDDLILEKIKKSVTDFTREVYYDPEKRAGVSNLIKIHSLATNKTVEEICAEAQTLETAQYKLRVADAVISHLQPIRKRFLEYVKRPEELTSLLKTGSSRAAIIAEKTLTEVQEKVGLGVNINLTNLDKL